MDLEKIMMSKAIMDRHSQMDKGVAPKPKSSPMMESFDAAPVKYNIPQEFMAESPLKSSPKPMGVPTVDAIKNSKLPDEIKRLMIEHPIDKPQQPQVGLSDELIEKASRLMKRNDSNYIPESAKPKETKAPQNIDYNVLQEMINEAVNNALKKSGILVESTEKTNEMFSFRVGKHLFEGKISKVKKLS